MAEGGLTLLDGGLTVFDGTLLRASLSHLPNPNGAVTGSDLLAMAESAASSTLYGLSLPEGLKSVALKRINVDAVSFALTEHDEEKATSILRNYVVAIADELKGNIVCGLLEKKLKCGCSGGWFYLGDMLVIDFVAIGFVFCFFFGSDLK